jgi:hypothetical protein
VNSTTGNVGIGTVTPVTSLDVAGGIYIRSSDGNGAGYLETSNEATSSNKLIIRSSRANGGILFKTWEPSTATSATWMTISSDSGDISRYQYSNTASSACDQIFIKGRGNSSTPLGVVADDVIAGFYAKAYNSSNVISTNNIAAIRMVATNTHTSAAAGVKIDFATTSNTSIARSVRMTIDSGGSIGIGTTTPSRGQLEVVGTNIGLTSSTGYYFNTTKTITSGVPGSSPLYAIDCSIYANNYVWSGVGFVASSDSRIKKDIVEIEDELALNTLRQLKPSTYRYIDTVSRTDEQVYGFIAQEVKEVLPYAVTQRKEVIPDIYQTGIITGDGLLTLSEDKLLNIGDRLRILTKDGIQPICVVTEVINSRTCLVELPNDFTSSVEPQEVFVYGREVEDFHVLQKDAVFTVGVSAVQELDRQVQQLRTENAQLRTELQEVKQQLQLIVERLNQ